MLHDIYEPGDPYPTCCAEDCRCGQPGDAVVHRHEDGTLTVDHYDRDRETLQLDTAGEYVYAYLRPDPRDRRVAIFGRVK
jgi:hypothetical protein